MRRFRNESHPETCARQTRTVLQGSAVPANVTGRAGASVGQAFQKGALACTIAPQQRHAGAGGYGQFDPVQDMAVTVEGIEAANLNHLAISLPR